MKYLLQEGAFSLFPADWQDSSMNILRDDKSGLSVVVSRGPIQQGSDFEQEFYRQWELLRPQMGEINQSAFTRVSVGAQKALRGVEVESAFERNGQQLWQKQLALQVPGKTVLMVFTFSALRPFSEEDNQRWHTLKQSLTLNEAQA